MNQNVCAMKDSEKLSELRLRVLDFKTQSIKKSDILICVGNYRHGKVYNHFFDTSFELSIAQVF